jgi:Bardet-Biedl syndrome 1 protein
VQWSCPFVDIHPREADIWNAVKSENMNATTAVKQLCEARDAGTRLSARSLDLIALESEAARTAYVNDMKDILYTQSTLITCMDTLKKDSEDYDSLTLLVVGTESGSTVCVP